jgi:hypothetical protein
MQSIEDCGTDSSDCAVLGFLIGIVSSSIPERDAWLDETGQVLTRGVLNQALAALERGDADGFEQLGKRGPGVIVRVGVR